MYKLVLTEEDLNTIAFCSNSYSWAYALYPYELGENNIPEHEAWEIKDAFEEDMKGGHSIFPMLNPNSDLYNKLIEFYNSIV